MVGEGEERRGGDNEQVDQSTFSLTHDKVTGRREWVVTSFPTRPCTSLRPGIRSGGFRGHD